MKMSFTSLFFSKDKFGLLVTPLQKIITGGTLVGVAFVASALVELKLEDTYPHPPGSDEARISFHNGLSTDGACKLSIEFPGDEMSGLSVSGGDYDRPQDDDDYDLVPFGVEDDVGYTLRVSIMQLDI